MKKLLSSWLCEDVRLTRILREQFNFSSKRSLKNITWPSIFDNKIYISELIHRNSKKFDLDPKIVAALIYQESSGDPFAAREEEIFYYTYVNNGKPLIGYVPKGITLETEMRLRSFSFGLMQIMGQVARENGYKRKNLGMLFLPEENIKLGCKLLSGWIAQKGSVAKGLLRYNGHGSYPALVMSHVNSGRYKKILITEE